VRHSFCLTPSVQRSKGDPVASGALHAVVEELIGAVWMQLAQSIVDQLRFARCAHCDKWFSLPPARQKIGRIYCSHTCRNRAHSDRTRGKSVKKPAAKKKAAGKKRKT
jgi:hypothetical protein